MINKEDLKEIINSTWSYLVEIFQRKEIEGGEIASIMLTILARFLNVSKKDCSQEQIYSLRKEFIDLIEEKLGK